MKPAPPSLLNYLQGEPAPPFSSSAGHWTNQNIHAERNLSRHHDYELDDAEKELPVDYAFLDEDEELDYNSVDGFMRRRKRSAGCELCLKTGLHVVYKRRDVSEDIHGDYSEYRE